MADEVVPVHPHSGPVHVFFGLSYASYLVLPRSVLQEMPIEWQERFVAMLHELGATFDDWEPGGGYMVTARGADNRFIQDPFREYRRPPPIPRRPAP